MIYESAETCAPSGATPHSPTGEYAPVGSGPRRTPRKSLIVVLPDDHVVTREKLSERLPPVDDSGGIDVILVCAGHPDRVAHIREIVRDARVLCAPSGTSGEDLRALAIDEAPGDIVTLLSGTRV